MNAQIKQLIRQATGPVIVRKWDDENHCHYNETEFKLDVEKFAELIVKESFTKLTPYMDDQFINDVEAELKDHFGITE